MDEYILNGGEIFKIIDIDTLRDGGNKIIRTTKNNYYVNKDNLHFHYSYPLSSKNVITDSSLIRYIIDRIDVHVKICEEDLFNKKNLLLQIKHKTNI